MKKTNTILIVLAIIIWSLFFSLTARAQEFNLMIPDGETVSKEPYNYVIQYWGTQYNTHVDNGSAWDQNDEVIHLKGFYSLRGLMEWINDDDISCLNCPYEEKSVRIWPSKLIEVVDLVRKEEINLGFKKEKKSRPEEVKIEYVEWEDKWYEIKQ